MKQRAAGIAPAAFFSTASDESQVLLLCHNIDGGGRMPIYKRCSRCGKRIPSGSTCSCVKQRHREYDRYSRDQKSKDFYGGKEWEMTRAVVLDVDDGIDVYLYMTQGVIVAADTVHHIIPIKDDWERRVDIDNMMSLSSDTHSMIGLSRCTGKIRVK